MQHGCDWVKTGFPDKAPTFHKSGDVLDTPDLRSPEALPLSRDDI